MRTTLPKIKEFNKAKLPVALLVIAPLRLADPVLVAPHTLLVWLETAGRTLCVKIVIIPYSRYNIDKISNKDYLVA